MRIFCALAFLLLLTAVAHAQMPAPRQTPDVSNKALLTTAAPALQGRADATALHRLAKEYYDWRNEQYPVRSSDAGLHTWDDRLTNYAPDKIAERAEHVPVAAGESEHHGDRCLAEG